MTDNQPIKVLSDHETEQVSGGRYCGDVHSCRCKACGEWHYCDLFQKLPKKCKKCGALLNPPPAESTGGGKDGSW